MPYNTPSIRIFKDDDSKTVENAFNDIFYGPLAQGQTEADGYPDDTLSNLPFNVADYEITAPEDLGETVNITNNTTTITTSTSGSPAIGPFTSGDVGKYLWNANTPTELELIGKISEYVANDEVELDSPYLGTTLTGATCYISSSSNNNANLSTNGEFIILIKTEAADDPDMRLFPSNTIGGLKTTSTLNGEYNVNGELNPTYITLMRISDKGVKGKPSVAAAVPATITRLNSYISADADDFFRYSEDLPLWVAYKINPFGTSSVNFSKNTAYSLEITETLPCYSGGIGTYTKKSSAASGIF